MSYVDVIIPSLHKFSAGLVNPIISNESPALHININ